MDELSYGKKMELLAKKYFRDSDIPEVKHELDKSKLLKLLKVSPRRHQKVIANLGSRYSSALILDLGYSIDFLTSKSGLSIPPYYGIDFLAYSKSKGWGRFFEKLEKIEALHEKGLYEKTNINKMAVVVVIPEDDDEEDSDINTTKRCIDESFDLFCAIEDQDNFLSSYVFDLRTHKKNLEGKPSELIVL